MFTWTKEQPIKDGHYWFRYKEFSPSVVVLVENKKILHPRKSIWSHFDNHYYKDSLWSGPIPEPIFPPK